MCNKRRTSLKNKEQKRLNSLLVVILLIMVLPGWGCDRTPAEPIYSNQVVINHYPEMAGAVFSRNVPELLSYVTHENPHVREYAWKAIAMSETDRINQILSTAMRLNEPAAWFALSFHALELDQLNSLKQLLLDKPDRFGGACEVFRRQGRSGDVSDLLPLAGHPIFDRTCARAIGTILSRETVQSADQTAVVKTAFEADDDTVRRNLLYGFYRSPLNRPEPESGLYNMLMHYWMESGPGFDSILDLFMVRILGNNAAMQMLSGGKDIQRIQDIQLAIELARNLPLSNENQSMVVDNIKNFLQHDNPHVAIQMLETLKSREFSEGVLNRFIYTGISSPTRNHELFVTSLEFLHQQNVDLSGLERKIAFAEESNHYLTYRFLELYRKIESAPQYLARIEKYLKSGGVRSLHAVQSLNQFWVEGEGMNYRSDVHRLVQQAVQDGDRSVHSGLQDLLTDENLINEEDFDWINAVYLEMAENEEFENSQQLGSALEIRFPERYEQRHRQPEVNFREPDWEKLYRLGTRPYWHLETEKGIVEVRLNPLSAPITVSSIDSLTSGGIYDGVAFHRVVRNFVVQGGDFERRDGSGGPGYAIPTEPSLDSYERGSAGMASAGTDTEGSQYFFMHIWAPHLDGSYTRFGDVVRGMDVVDRLQVGDRVVRAEVSIR